MRYPSEDVARFDQQFAETEDERNDRLRRKRKAIAPSASATCPLIQNGGDHMANGLGRCWACGAELSEGVKHG